MTLVDQVVVADVGVVGMVHRHVVLFDCLKRVKVRLSRLGWVLLLGQ